MSISINTDLLFDTSETLFGQNIFLDLKESKEYLQKADFILKLKEYNNNLKSLGLNISLSKVKKIEIRDTTEIVGGVKPIGQDEYLFVVSKYVLDKNKAKYLETMCYHELCHLYQLNKLFNENIIYWNYGKNKLMAEDNKKELVYKHLKEKRSHTIYWQEAVDQINNNLKLEIPIKAELSQDELVNLFLENFFKLTEDADAEINIGLIE